MKKPILLVLGTALVLTGCSEEEEAAPRASTSLAKVGAKEILPADLVAEAQRRISTGRQLPDKETLLDEMVFEEAMVQQALALGLDKDPEVARTWRSLLIGTLKSRKLEPELTGIEIPADAVQGWYDTNQASFALPEKARLGLIFAALSPRASAEQAAPIRARMDEARALAAAGSDGFKQAAAKYSDHQSSRYRGGEIGWVVRGKVPTFLTQKVMDAAFALPPGGLSEVIEDRGGLYLLTMLEHSPASIRPLAQVERTIRTTLTSQRRKSLQQEFDDAVRKRSGVQIFPDRLKQIELPAARPSIEPPTVPRTP